jgi:hypothetical protein
MEKAPVHQQGWRMAAPPERSWHSGKAQAQGRRLFAGVGGVSHGAAGSKLVHLGRLGVHAGLCGMEMAEAPSGWATKNGRWTINKCECFLLYLLMKKC